MAAPIPSYIALPDDSTNTGKKIRTETRVIGGGTVHEHFYVPTLGYNVVGHYFFSSSQQSVSQTAGVSTLWFQNPVSSTITMVVRSVIIDVTAGSAQANGVTSSISVGKGTYTGTPTGAVVSSLPYTASSPAAHVIIRTASTGMSLIDRGEFGFIILPSTLTALGTFYASKIVYAKNPLSFVRGLDVEIAPGEYMYVIQDGPGTAGDTRKFGIQVEWDEVDLG